MNPSLFYSATTIEGSMSNVLEYLAGVDLDVLTIGAFLVIFFVLFVVGRILTLSRRNRPTELPRRALAFGIFTRPLSWLLPAMSNREELQKDLRRAGYYHRYAFQEFLAIRNVLLFGWIGLIALTYWSIGQSNPVFKVPIIILGVVIAIILYSLPRLILQTQANARLHRITHSLPDALDMTTMSMTGGLPLIKALEHVSEELTSTHPDLACELKIVSRQTKALSLDTALRELADRIDIPDVQSLSALVSQTTRLGANVATAFQDYSDSVRRTIRQRAEERGNKASVKLLLPIIFCLAPPVYILLLAPAMLELRNFVIDQNRPGGALSQDVEVTQPQIPRLVADPDNVPTPANDNSF